VAVPSLARLWHYFANVAHIRATKKARRGIEEEEEAELKWLWRAEGRPALLIITIIGREEEDLLHFFERQLPFGKFRH
jgi:hypothetical protein